jgi:hypothetical protein
MRNIFIILGLVLSNLVTAQDINVPTAGCPINTISTHPDNYQNSSDSDESQKWDWRTETFTAYYKQVGMGDLGFPNSIRSPFHELISNPNVNRYTDAIEKDYRNEDGWELLYHVFGSTEKGLDNPFFMLYNRFSGTIRVFVNIRNSGSANSNAASITLAFPDGVRRTAVFNQLGLHTRALDDFDKKARTSNNNRYVNSGVNDNYYWLSADFNSMYDPCTCGLASDFLLFVTLISDTKVDLSINGTITTLLDNTGTSQNISANSPLSSIQQYLNFGTSLITDVQGLFSSANEQHATGVQLQNAANQFVLNNSGLFGSQAADSIARQIELILFEVPTIGQLLKFSSTLISTIKKTGANFNALSATQKQAYVKNSTVTTQNVKLSVTGSLVQSAAFVDALLAVPGSINSELPEHRRPVYDNVLGVFNLAENPRIKLTRYKPPSDLQIPYGNEILPNSDWNYFPYLYKAEVMDVLKPILNPASGLKIVSLEARVEYLNREGPSIGLKGPMKLGKLRNYQDISFLDGFIGSREDYYESIGVNFVQFDKNNFNNAFYKWDKSMFASDFVSQGCFQGTRLFSFSKMENMVIKVNVVLEPINSDPNSEVDKILVVYTYPATIVNEDSPIFYQVTGATNNVVLHENIGYNELGLIIPGVPNVTSLEYPNDLFLTNQIISQDIFAKGKITIGPNVQFNQNNLVIECLSEMQILNTPLLTFGNAQSLIFRSKELINVFPEVILDASVTLEINSTMKVPCDYGFIALVPPNELATFCNSNKYDGLSRPSRFQDDGNQVASEIKEDVEFTISLFPNPASSRATIQLAYDVRETTISIFDMTGRQISVEINQTGRDYELDLSKVLTGVYQVEIRNDLGTFIKPLIVK